MKKKCQPHFSESKDGHGPVWNKILYVTRDESRFFSWAVTALTKRIFRYSMHKIWFYCTFYNFLKSLLRRLH